VTLFARRVPYRNLTIYTYGRIMVHVYDDGEIVVQDWNHGYGSVPASQTDARNRAVWNRS
jgi:hypothetical protein